MNWEHDSEGATALLDAGDANSAPIVAAPTSAGAPGDGAPAALATFDELVEAHQGRIARLVHRLLGWRGGRDVDDVVQEVFLRALARRSTFRGDASVGTWLTAIAVNQCRSHQRRWRQAWRLFVSAGEYEAGSTAAPAERDLATAEVSKRVREAVQALPPRDREVVVLRHFEGMTASEIAAMTGQKTNAVEVRLHRARARLAQSLGEWHREEQL